MLVILGSCRQEDMVVDADMNSIEDVDYFKNKITNKDNIRSYFDRLQAVNDSLINNASVATRGDLLKNPVVAADVSGAWSGAKWGWKKGKTLKSRVALSVVSGAIMGAVSSYMAHERSSPRGVKRKVNDIDFSIIYVPVKDNSINCVLTSYVFRTEARDWIWHDFSGLQFYDYYYLDPSENNEIELFDEETGETETFDTRLIAAIHNDALNFMMNNDEVMNVTDDMLQLLEIEAIDTPAFDYSMDKMGSLFLDQGVNWIWDIDNPLVEPLENDIFLGEHQQPTMEKTINMFMEGIININMDVSGITSVINYVDAYNSIIDDAEFMTEDNKVLLKSSILVGAYSLQYWVNYYDGVYQ